MEPFIVAAMRQLSSAHPVYKLIKPYFRYTPHKQRGTWGF